MSTLQCLVEGDGEVSALPVLIRRICAEIAPGLQIDVPRPVKAKASQVFQNDWHLLRLAAGSARVTPGQPSAVLVLLDTDGKRLPCEIVPAMLDEVRDNVGGLPCGLVLAHCEFETWFIAAADSLRGRRDLSDDLTVPPQPEAIRGAKEWLSDHTPPGRCYRETIDQPALAAQFNLDQARQNSSSFDKFWRTVASLVGQLEHG